MHDVTDPTLRARGASAPESSVRNRAVERGVAPSYVSATGETEEVPSDVLAAVLDALGPSDHADRVVPPFLAGFAGDPVLVPLARSEDATGLPEVSLVLEDGTPGPVPASTRVHDGTVLVFGTDLPVGYHRLVVTRTQPVGAGARVAVEESTLLVAPARAPEVPVADSESLWGITVQLYSVRSSRSWGVGDLGDLAELMALGAARGADFVLINPIHAQAPVPPVENSPYLPSSRMAIDPVYIAVEESVEFAHADPRLRARAAAIREDWAARARAGEPIDRDAVLNDKLEILTRLFGVWTGWARSGRFVAHRDGLPEGTRAWAEHNARVVRETGVTAVGTAADAAVLADPDFWCWTQFVLAEQLDTVRRTGEDLGMRLGLVTDLAVGVAGDGADAHTLAPYQARGMSVGAPADFYNQLGQDWAQPPWHPERLAAAGYRPLRDLFRTAFTGAGGIRIDHVMWLFRLWWVPAGNAAKDGAYVSYDSRAMLAVLLTEAARAGVVVIGEDLGTVAPGVREALEARGVLGTSVLWFERREDGTLTEPADHRRTSLATVDTHDMQPTTGYVDLEDVDLSARLGQLVTEVTDFRESERADRQAALDALRPAGIGMPPDVEVGAVSDPMAVDLALHRYLGRSRAVLVGVALTDVVGERRAQNKPGTSTEYPNWTVPLADLDGRPVLLDDLADASTPAGRALDRFAAAVSGTEPV
ncbi:4-alpha-glucanotransferase [Brevibacterium litoralis]|uniref:4-alpha-glucanotransferase n=1 Tax=Brevibacterium litoralis TaxID=3138935 RepID=UPI0032EE9D06